MPDKQIELSEAIASIESGMTIGIGGWGSRRKPMAMVRELLRSDVKDLTVVSLGGPDVGLLVAAGKVRKLVYGFVTLDSIPLDPLFTAARERGELELQEYDEGMFVTGLRAAANRLSFLPTLAGIGSDVLAANKHLKTIQSPYSDDEYVAVPAIHMDVALIHVNRADSAGNVQFLGPDPYFDDLYAMAATRTFVSTERVIPNENLLDEGSFHTLMLSRMYVTGVVETPRGAHFTTCEPDYGRDEPFQRHYAAAAKDPEAWRAFSAEFLERDEAGYHEAVARFHALQEKN